MTHTDIKTEGIIAKLPAHWRPYALIMRLDRPVGWMLLLLPALWAIVLGAGGLVNFMAREWILTALFVLGAVFMRAAGCIINDIWDRDIDKQVERTAARPLASGALSLRSALILLAMLLLLSFAILLTLPPVAIFLGMFSILPIALYPAMKRITWWPQLFLGVTFNMGALIGWAALYNEISLVSILLYASGVFWTLGYDTVYAHQDISDDSMIGVKSTARLFAGRSRVFVGACYAVSFAFMLAAMAAYDLQTPLPFALISLAGAHLVYQMKIWDKNDPQSSLMVFKSNRDYGALVLLALAFSGF